MKESKIDNYIERMQQPLIPEKPKKNLKIFFAHAVWFGKNCQNDD